MLWQVLQPKELLIALAVALVKFQEGKPFFVNAYPRVVTREGSREAQKLVADMMENCDTEWRGLGIIPEFRPASEKRMGSLRCEKEVPCA